MHGIGFNDNHVHWTTTYIKLETGRKLFFLTNNLENPALIGALLYEMRWCIGLFFRWIKGHLRIKCCFGTSPDAVNTQK